MTNTEKSITQLLRIGIFLVPFIPLVVASSMYFPFVTGKNFAFRILVEVLAFFWVWMMVVFNRFRPKFSLIVGAYAAFIAVLALAAIFGLSPYESFWSRFERMEGLLGHIHLFLFFIIAGSVLTSEQDWKKFFNISIAVSAVVMIYAFIQLAGFAHITQGGARVTSTMGNAIYLAVYLLFHIFFIAIMFFESKKGWLKYTYLGLFLIEVIALYYTASRGPLLGLFVGLTIFVLIIAFLERGRIRTFAICGMIVILLIPIAVFLARNSEFVSSSDTLGRFTTALSDPASSGRFTIWKMALRGWQERPMLGWGQENFVYVFSKYYEPSLWRNEPWFDRAHNIYLDWLVAGGIFGLLAYISIFVSAIFLLFKRFRNGTMGRYGFAGFAALLSAYFLQNFFVFDSIVSYTPFLSVIAFVHFASVVDKAQKVDKYRRFDSTAWRIAVVAAAGAFLLYSVFVFNIQPIRAARSITRVSMIFRNPNPAGKVDALLKELRLGIGFNTFGTTEILGFAHQNFYMINNPGIVESEKRKYLSFLIEEMEKQRSKNPHNVLIMALMADMYLAAGRFDDVVKVVNEAFQISDKRQQFYFILASAYLDKGERSEAIDILRKAYDLDPENYQAMTNLAVSLIVSGRVNEGEDLVEKLLGTRIFGDEKYAVAYRTIGDIGKEVQVREKLIIINPANFNYRIELGRAYFQLGKKDKAIGEIRKAMELESRFKAQGEELIKEVEESIK